MTELVNTCRTLRTVSAFIKCMLLLLFFAVVGTELRASCMQPTTELHPWRLLLLLINHMYLSRCNKVELMGKLLPETKTTNITQEQVTQVLHFTFSFLLPNFYHHQQKEGGKKGRKTEGVPQE